MVQHRREYLEGLEKMSKSFVALGTVLSEEGKQEAAAITSVGSGLMCTLFLINDTLEEIRDAIKQADPRS